MNDYSENLETEAEEIIAEAKAEMGESDDSTPFRELSQSEDIELDVREAYEELKTAKEKESEGSKDSVAREVEGVAPEGVKTEDKKPTQPAEGVVRPPADWTIEDKQWFEKQDPIVKKNIAKRTTDLTRRINEVNEKWASIRKDYEEFEQAITPYKSQFDIAGVSKGEGIKRLLAVNDFLRKDPIAGLEYLAGTFNMTLKQAVELAEQRGVAPMAMEPASTAYQDPSIQELTNRLNSLIEEIQREKTAPVVSGFRQAGEKLKYETDSSGQYLRPELHDDNFVLSLKPLVDGLKLSDPDLSPEDLILRAYHARTGRPMSAPASRMVPTPNRNGAAARRATLSNRGSALASPKQAPQNVPDSVEETNFQIARELGFDV